ncbi:hypothetical protein ES708_33406 [subsurface metagenome]
MGHNKAVATCPQVEIQVNYASLAGELHNGCRRGVGIHYLSPGSVGSGKDYIGRPGRVAGGINVVIGSMRGNQDQGAVISISAGGIQGGLDGSIRSSPGFAVSGSAIGGNKERISYGSAQGSNGGCLDDIGLDSLGFVLRPVRHYCTAPTISWTLNTFRVAVALCWKFTVSPLLTRMSKI